eukprot:c20212_g2_i1.p1 GENE.c20212_g2_i1~~c20212_g2_i1.p1  ORF type:complete len:576 (+),score=104.97 c20212_g2_i1:713-2440(+)
MRFSLSWPGGLLVTTSVCLVPLTVHGLQEIVTAAIPAAPITGDNTPVPLALSLVQSLVHLMHRQVTAKWIVMEAVTAAIGIIAVRYFNFPSLLAPITFSAFFLALDLPQLLLGQVNTRRVKWWISLFFGALLLVAAVDVDLVFRCEQDFEPEARDWGLLLWLLGVCIFYPAHTHLTVAFAYDWGWRGLKHLPHLVNANQIIIGRLLWYIAFHLGVVLLCTLLTRREAPVVLSAAMLAPGFVVATLVSRKWLPPVVWVASVILMLTSIGLSNQSSHFTFKASSALTHIVPMFSGLLGCLCVFVLRLYRRRSSPFRQALASSLMVALSWVFIVLSTLPENRWYSLCLALLGVVGVLLGVLRIGLGSARDHVVCLFCLRMCFFAKAIENDPLLFAMGILSLCSTLAFLRTQTPSNHPSTTPVTGDTQSTNQLFDVLHHLAVALLFRFTPMRVCSFAYSVALILAAAPLNSVFLAMMGLIGIVAFTTNVCADRGDSRAVQFWVLTLVGMGLWGTGFVWDQYREQVVWFFLQVLAHTRTQVVLEHVWQPTNQRKVLAGEVEQVVGNFWAVLLQWGGLGRI